MLNYKKLLSERYNELQENLKALEESAKPVDLNMPIGRLSRMDEMQQQQMALNAKKQIQLNLELLEQAQKRLDQGDYGICLKCEEEISEKRLKAKPETAFCTDCQK